MPDQGHSGEIRIKREVPWGELAAVMLLVPFLPIASVSISQDSSSPGGAMTMPWLA